MYDINTVNRIENSSNPNNIITTTYNQMSSPYKKEYKPKVNNIDNKQKKNDTYSQHNSSKKNKKTSIYETINKSKEI